MKHETLLSSLTGALLGFFTAWGALGCLISAFDLTLTHPAGPVTVCLLASLICAAALIFSRGSIVLLCGLAAGCGYIYHDGRAAVQLWQLLHRLTVIYDRAYGLGVLVLPENIPAGGTADWPLGILGALMAIATVYSVCRQKTVWLPVSAVILPLCSCIVVTDTVPDAPWLLMVMAGLVLLILTGPVRRENRAHGIRLTAVAALPVVLALGGLFLVFPQNSYVNHSEILRENILTAARYLPRILETGLPETTTGLSRRLPQTIDLAALGERIPFSYPVMEVTAEKSGTLYLRGRDYDRYDGLGWTATHDRTETFSLTDGPRQTIRIETRNRKEILYLPYYPASPVTLTAGTAENPEERQILDLVCTALPDTWRQTAYESTDLPEEQWQDCLSLPDTTRQGAAPFLEQLQGRALSNTAKADIIAALVTDSARYDTRTGKMPPQEPDFALWFLREADTGYCVHFATAATVLLRSAGVPARYVTGYMVQARAGQTITVTEEDAHAWAEYYEPGLNLWIPLEATPAAESAPAPRPLREESPVVTQPETEPGSLKTTCPKRKRLLQEKPDCKPCL